MIKNIQFLITCLCLCLYPQLAMADSATASLDRSITEWGESVQLTIHVEGSADKEPDLSALNQNFEVLNQSQSSNYNLTNGSLKRSKQWVINLMPKRTGVLTIPAISLGNVSTSALSLKVLAQQNQVAKTQNKDIFLEVSATPQDSYVQAQILLVVKLFRAVNLAQAQLTEPDMPDVLIKKIGKDRSYETARNQRRFVVTERRYAIFPQRSGTLHIPALQFTGQVANRLGMFNQAGRVVRVQSQPLNLVIRPMPHTWPQGQAWLPAQNVTIQEIFPDGDMPTLKVGEPLTRTIEIRAKGLTAEQLPQIFSQTKSAAFKQYPDKPELSTEIGVDGIVGIRREKIALIPTQEGDFKLPGLSVLWWNTDTDSLQKVEVLDRMVEVEKGIQNMPLASEATAITVEKTNIGSEESRRENFDNGLQSEVYLWQALTALFGMVCLLIAVSWWYSSKQNKEVGNIQIKSRKEKELSLKKLRKKLEVACKDNEAKEVANLLAKWGSSFFEDENMTSFIQLKGKSGVMDGALLELEESLYGKASQTQAWKGEAILKALSTLSLSKKEVEGLGLKPLS